MTEKIIINETISLNEMILSGEGERRGYVHDCRCGGVYTVSARELLKEELIVPCDTCSLNVQVIHSN